jgi:hypothetical protein
LCGPSRAELSLALTYLLAAEMEIARAWSKGSCPAHTRDMLCPVSCRYVPYVPWRHFTHTQGAEGVVVFGSWLRQAATATAAEGAAASGVAAGGGGAGEPVVLVVMALAYLRWSCCWWWWWW